MHLRIHPGCWWWTICWPPVERLQQRDNLVEQAGGCLVGFAFVIELEGLGGRQALPAGQPVDALLRYG